jgi:DNA-binding YbaB/EbfC family protein
MKDMFGLMKQAQAMQQKMADLQAELDNVTVEGQAGAGMVKITMTAKGVMRAVLIDPSLMKESEKEIVEDLVVTAHEDARRKGEALVAEKMQAITAGLPLPPGMKLPF